MAKLSINLRNWGPHSSRDIPQLTAEDMLKPEAIAETYWHL